MPPLALFLKTSAGDQIDLSCCNTPVVMQLPVDSGVTYRIELAYVGRPASYPQVPPVDYTLETALLPFEAQSPRALQAIVLGDPTRPQRLSHARLEVLDGPAAGTVARFDEATGLYEFAGLPAGFVLILASADGFTPYGTAAGRSQPSSRADAGAARSIAGRNQHACRRHLGGRVRAEVRVERRKGRDSRRSARRGFHVH